MQIVQTSSTPTVRQAVAAAPRFSGGIEYTGTTGKFTSFTARSVGTLGAAKGYASIETALGALTQLTVGAHIGAAGVFERDGRFFGRTFEVAQTYASGATWKGPWRLEQHPDDAKLIDAKAVDTTTRADALRAIVDGAQRVDVTHLPVATKAKPEG